MARGVASPPRPPALPQAVFTKVDIDPARRRKGASKQLQAFGYNDGNEWERPERYIRYHEPLESVLNQQVEYDMDEQDEEWLRLVNADRKSQQLDSISYETFEIVMDRLEKEWFGLTKNIPQPDHAMPSEDSTCAICDDAEGENMNAIVFCDGCNLAVHQDCYGVPYIPEGQWLCRKCTVAPEDTVDCLLCPNEGGAFKQTQQGQWVHLLCALWIRETQVVNTTFMDPISGVDSIPRTRWKLRCSICKIHHGAPIQCAKTQCFTAFHVTCARRDKLLMPMKSSDGSDGALEAFCDKHLPPGQRELHEAALASREAEDTSSGLRTTKAARAYAKTYTTGPPLVPALIIRRIVEYITSLSVRKKEAFVQLVARYWSLKREARRGAPLLKRLHLEPWTAIAGRAEVSVEDKQLKLEVLQKLRGNLATARDLTDAVVGRETFKLQQAQVISDAISRALYPFHAVLKMIVGKLMGHDKNGYFKHPVSREVAPDYEERIKQPMWWQLIEEKLELHAYWDTGSFSSDIMLVVNNAMEYNKSDSPIYKTAARIKNYAQTHLAELAKFTTQHPMLEAPSVDRLFDASTFTLGDLEPSQHIIDFFDSEELLTSELDIILGQAPAAALLAYEHANNKPPPPPPRVIKSRRTAKRNYKERARTAGNRLLSEQDDAELQQVQAIAKELDAQDALDTSPGFRSRTTRGRAAKKPVAGPSTISPPMPAVETPGGRGSSRKGRQEAPPVVERSGVPLLVEDVGNRQSFLAFETGWILPEGAKRHRSTVAPSAQRGTPNRGPPRKRQRLAAPAASVASAVASTSSKVRSATTPPSSRESSPLSEPSDNERMEVDDSQGVAPPQPEVGEPSEAATVVREAASEAVPAPMAQPMVQASLSDDTGLAQGVEPNSSPVEEDPVIDTLEVEAVFPLGDSTEMDADVAIGPLVAPELDEVAPFGNSVISDTDTAPRKAIIIEVIDTPETRRAQAMARKKARLEAQAAEGSKQGVASGPMYKPGDAVWVKTGIYPWWPAVVQDYNGVEDMRYHRDIHTRMSNNDAKPKELRQDLFVAHYYQENNMDACVSLKQLKPLGDNKDSDATVLKKNKYRSSGMKSRCLAAYQDALHAKFPSTEATSESQHDNAGAI